MTMLASPLLFALWERIAGSELARAPGARTRRAADGAEVIIIGYGLNGRNLSRVLRETGIRYRILELNAETFQRGSAHGEPITFGDATRTAVLEHVGVRSAAVVVVAISDPAATRRVTATVRRLNPSVALIVRTRHVREIEDLKREGADEVISEEFETSVEIFARVLSRLHVPHNVIQTQVDLVRSEGYAMLRGMAPTAGSFENLRAVLAASTTETHLLRAGSPAVGRSIRELDLRRRTGTTIIAVVHDGQPYPNPPAHFVLQAGNVLVLLGSHRELAQAEQLLRAPAGRPAP
jgi:CPA2 family monovalent cation:H+ antiporter-2